MGSVHVGIGHDDDLVIAKLRDIKILMNTGTKSGDHGFNLSVCIDFVKSCLFYIQNLSA